MPTGACGINCDVCRLKLVGICSSCGAGISQEAEKKLEAQMKLFGHPCPILACAQLNKIQYCLRDCRSFPCDNFQAGPYPFSEGYLAMQKRRRMQKPLSRTPAGDLIKVSPEHWDELHKKDLNILCHDSLATLQPHEGLRFRFLNVEVLVDIHNNCIKRRDDDGWEKIENSLLELVILVYLLHVTPSTLAGEMISVKDLKDAHFFQGPHTLKTAPVLERYGDDLAGFKLAAEKLDGEPMDLADAAYRFTPLPRIPICYLLWEGDEEFKPNLSILFDHSIERHLSADAIWGLVILVSDALLLSG